MPVDQKVLSSFEKQYGKKKGKQVAFATANKEGGGLYKAMHGGKSKSEEKDAAYREGFTAACAARGVDAETLIKQSYSGRQKTEATAKGIGGGLAGAAGGAALGFGGGVGLPLLLTRLEKGGPAFRKLMNAHRGPPSSAGLAKAMLMLAATVSGLGGGALGGIAGGALGARAGVRSGLEPETLKEKLHLV